MEIIELLEKLPINTKITKGKNGWWTAKSIWNIETKNYMYKNHSQGLELTLIRLLEKIQVDYPDKKR